MPYFPFKSLSCFNSLLALVKLFNKPLLAIPINPVITFAVVLPIPGNFCAVLIIALRAPVMPLKPVTTVPILPALIIVLKKS